MVQEFPRFNGSPKNQDSSHETLVILTGCWYHHKYFMIHDNSRTKSLVHDHDSWTEHHEPPLVRGSSWSFMNDSRKLFVAVLRYISSKSTFRNLGKVVLPRAPLLWQDENLIPVNAAVFRVLFSLLKSHIPFSWRAHERQIHLVMKNEK